MSIDNRLAVLALIACDDSYQSKWEKGDPLLTYPDSKAINGVPEPDPIPGHLMQRAGLEFTYLFRAGAYRIGGWSVAESVTDPATGFGAVIFQNDAKTEAIVAFTGTNGLTPQGLQGWYTDLTLARTQWSTQNRAETQTRIEALRAADGSPFTGTVNFTGQSLGGALAQYALYDFAIARGAAFDANRVMLTTYNGLGGIDFLSSRGDFEQITGKLADVQTTHYTIHNDVVHRLGGGQINAAGNTYQLRFTETVPGFEFIDAEGKIVEVPPREVPYDLVDAHRIESGFYRGFTQTGGDFSAARAYTPQLISAEAARSIADGFGNLLNDRDHSPWESGARIIAGIAASVAVNPLGSREIATELLKSAKLSARTGQASAMWSLLEFAVPKGLRAADLLPAVRLPLLAGATYAVGIASAMDLVQEIGESAIDVREHVLSLIDEASGFSPSGTADYDFAAALVDDSGLQAQQAKASMALAAAAGMLPGVSAEVSAAVFADQNAALQSLQSESWIKDFLRYITGKVHQTRTAAGATAEEVQRDVGEALAGISKGIYAFGQKFSDGTAASMASLQSLATTIKGGIDGTLKSAANAYEEFTAKYADPLFSWGTSLTRSALEEMRRGFDIALRTAANDPLALVGISSASATTFADDLRSAEAFLMKAAQTVLILPGREGNPFDDAGFDSDAAPVSMGALEEGSFSTFTAYLPYEAGQGGQRIRLELAGAAAELLVYVGGEEVELGAEGEFSLTVSEGQREISFEVFALEDVDADETLMLSAQLVDAAGEGTHLEHEELSLTLAAVLEQAPQGGREIRGDWAAKFFTNPDTGQPEVRMDDLGNVEREPGTVSTGDVEADQLLGGSAGTDRVFTGDFDERAYTYGGNDAIFGSSVSGNILLSGAGDDWVEGGGNSQLMEPEYREIVYQGRIVRLGDDQIYGGAGDDQIWGDAASSQDLLNAPDPIATGLPGDWVNGGSGNDRLYGTAGDDVLLGGIGEDLMQGGAGTDVLLGDESFNLAIPGNYWRVMHPFFTDQTFRGFELGLFPVYNYAPLVTNPLDIDPNVQDQYVTYYKQGGDDILIGGAGRDILIGQYGRDTVYGGEDDDVLAGWEGDDTLVGGGGNDLIAGDFGRYELPNQRLLNSPNVGIAGLVGSASFDSGVVDQEGNDYLDGGAGNDQIWGEGGADTVLGDAGDDVLYGDADYLPEELQGADLVDGGTGADRIYGGGGNDRLFAGDGDDVIDAGAGDDAVDGGTGADTIAGGDGHDVLKGGEGLDRIDGNDGHDTLHGGTGNDELDGGEGDDTLHGEAGADSLEGGAGADHLHGGSGEDVLSGGDGDDRLDGGAGIDVLRGGEGDDTYVMALGYGRDIIEDTQGRSRFSFGAGVIAGEMNASVDSTTLAATITFSGIGDTIAFNAGEVDLAGVDFASGASWGRKEFLGFLPAILKQGSEEGETLSGHGSLRNDLRGEGGDDTVDGSANDDTLAGGSGADALDGKRGSDRYFYAADESGIDILADSGISAQAYLEWFYTSRGIADWEERGLHGGQYRAEASGEGGSFREYFDTYEEALDQYPLATITQIEPLLEIAPLVARHDDAALETLAAAGVLDRDVVEFGAGIAFENLTVTLRVNAAEAAGYPHEPTHARGTLSVRWNAGAAGFELAVPDTAYGFPGEDLFADGGGNSEDPDTWRGYRLGEGIEEFRFADGSAYSLQEMLSLATIVEIVAPLRVGRDQGAITIGRNYEAVVFEDAISAFEIGISREGIDLLLAGPGTLVRIAGWFADPAGMPATRVEFELDSPIAAVDLTEAALIVSGTEADEVLQGLDAFPDTLYGNDGNDTLRGRGGDDTLDGGDGDDLLVGGEGNDSLNGGRGADVLMLERGGGHDRYEWSFESEVPASEDRIRAGAHVLPGQVLTMRGSSGLSVWVEGTGDRIEIPNWFDDETARLAGIEFADGTFWDADEMEARLKPAPGTEGDDAIFGTSGDDSIDALGGSDFIYGDDGDDVIAGGADDDEIDPGEGYDIARGGDGDDSLDGGGEANDLLEGGAGDDYIYLEGHTLTIGGVGNDWIDNFGPGAVVAFNPGDGHDTIYIHDSLTLSVGGGIQAGALALSEEGDGLLLSIGTSDSIRLTREFEPDPQAWPEITLQLFGSVHTFDFNGVIADFYAALAADPTIASFPLAGVLEGHRTGFSEDGALGGALAWRYATTGSTAGLTDEQVRSVLRDAAFGTDAQPISLGNGNGAPIVANPLADQEIAEDSDFRCAVPTDAFADADGDALTYSVSLVDGSPLPAWLAFDPATATFTGTPENGDVGTLEILVTASDASGLSVSDDFSITVENVNDAPALANPIADHRASAEEPFSFSFAATAFADADQGDTLSYSAALADGSALPVWLAFDGTTRTFNGTPPAAESLLVRVTAADSAGALAADEFSLEVSGAAGETIVGTPANDALVGTRGDDLLAGGRGNDTLAGGLGDDVYLHELRGGHDVIKDSGGNDTLLLGPGITGRMVRLERRRHDLVVDLAGPHGSVTIKDWFASASRRVDRIQFADGTAWDEETIRERTGRDHGHCDVPRHEGGHHHHNGSYRDDERKHERPDESRRDHVAERVSELLRRAPRFDFDRLIESLQAPAPSLRAKEISQRWTAVRRYAETLEGRESEDDGGGLSLAGWVRAGRMDWGFEGSTGGSRAQEELKALEGLKEGFRRL
jgi:Ca2+-binding RTX toxin-like protein